MKKNCAERDLSKRLSPPPLGLSFYVNTYEWNTEDMFLPVGNSYLLKFKRSKITNHNLVYTHKLFINLQISHTVRKGRVMNENMVYSNQSLHR